MATLLQAFQTRTWCSNNLYQTPLTESAAYASDADTRTGWAGLNQTAPTACPTADTCWSCAAKSPPARART